MNKMRCNNYVRIMMLVDSENSGFFVYLHFDTAAWCKIISNRVIIGTLCIPSSCFGLWNGIHLCAKKEVVSESVT